jgi:hypothetical protein
MFRILYFLEGLFFRVVDRLHPVAAPIWRMAHWLVGLPCVGFGIGMLVLTWQAEPALMTTPEQLRSAQIGLTLVSLILITGYSLMIWYREYNLRKRAVA